MTSVGRPGLRVRRAPERSLAGEKQAAWFEAAFVVLLLLAIGLSSQAERPILDFTVSPPVLEIAPGASASGQVAVRNASPYEADEVDFTWTGPEGFALDPEPPSIAVVKGYGAATVPLSVTAGASVPTGAVRGTLEVVYSYCIADSCFEIVETVPVSLRVAQEVQTAPAVVASPTTGSSRPESPVFPWRPVLFGAMLVLLLPVLWIRTSGRLRAVWVALVAVAAAASLAVGVSLDQHRQAQAVGAVLCTSCVGIETAETRTPTLSAAQAAAVDRLTNPVALVVFYAPWCRSCPYAEGLVDLIARRNPLVQYSLVNADEEKDLAARYGVTRTGRTVVPAIVRVDTGSVLFGAEDLGDRLLALLREGT